MTSLATKSHGVRKSRLLASIKTFCSINLSICSLQGQGHVGYEILLSVAETETPKMVENGLATIEVKLKSIDPSGDRKLGDVIHQKNTEN